jgi:3-deoxy-D-manno-octulosonate 8-phosphate phosphatase (KDO 8-P phosphatase)
MKAFNTQDGHGMKMLKASGVALAIITGRRSRLVELRAANLGIEHLYQGAENKLAAFQELLARLKLKPEQAAYMGDDVVDLPVMRRCGFAASVPEAPAVVREHAHYVTRNAGGRGAVREFCELVMQAQGTLDTQLAPYLE